MSWRDTLALGGRGSFRGVEFHVSEVESSIGRRTVVSEHPGGDKPTSEDLGRRSRRITIDAFLIGDDYPARRDELWAALETEGPGELVHPYRGSMNVVVDGSVSVRETTEDGGMCRFRFSVVEAGDELTMAAEPDTETETEEAVEELEAASAEDFEDDYSLIAAAAAAVNDAQAMVNAAISAAREVQGAVASAVAAVEGAVATIDAMAEAVADIIALPAQLAAEMQNLAATVTGSLGKITGALALYESDDGETAAADRGASSPTYRAEVAIRAYSDMAAAFDDISPDSGTSVTAEQIAANRTAIEAQWLAACIGETIRQLITLVPDTADDAAAMLDPMLDAIDDLSEIASDRTYAALQRLRAAFAAHVEAVAVDRPSLGQYTPAQTEPALVIAHRLFGDATRDAEIIARNNVRDPLMVPGGQELQVVR